MNFDTFVQLFRERLQEGRVLENPGGGTSTVMRSNDTRTLYMRGASRYYIEHCALYHAYQKFAGGSVTTSQLREYAPGVFDSAQNGHNCHCTFFFLALMEMDIVDGIWGGGCAGDPFGVTIPALQASA